MKHQIAQLWAFHSWAIVAAASALVTVISIVADRRRSKRHRLDKVGFMPWTGISIMATLVTVIAIALSLKVG
jgi:hypothetical protein